MYNAINRDVKEIIKTETDLIANLANITALIKLGLENVGWVGFFLVKGEELILGPFQGNPATTRIKFGKGVCGAVAASKDIQLVMDVNDFPRHLACDSSSNSEVCLPIIINNRVVGVLDLDSPLVGRFGEEDVKGLSMIIETLKASIKFD